MFRTITLAALAFTALARAQPPVEQKMPENVNKAKDVVVAHLAKIKGQNGTIDWIKDDSLAKTFPQHVFFAVRFRIYPVAMQLPEGMKPSNIFAVKGGKFEHVKDAKALEAFFKGNAVNVNSPNVPKAAEFAVRSWLLLAQEFVQDGFYKFEILDKAFQVVTVMPDKAKKSFTDSATGRAVVMQGGNGEIGVSMIWDRQGKVQSVTDTTKVKPGPRPICQATKLLDADPVVRKMAEADLLFMGLAAREYIMEQRAAAAPELRDAIDRLWERIVKNGW